jgi:uncharacterized protein YjbI with pentapeptide repeats
MQFHFSTGMRNYMDANHQDKIGSNLKATEDKLWLPPLSTKDQKKLDHLRKKPFAQRMGFAGKTPWDFIQLLLIPLVLAGVGFWFSAQQNQTSLQVSERQHQADLQIAATRYANDQQLAADQQRETTLKTYLDDLSNLLLNNKLLESKPGDAVRQVARERTLTTLRRLEANRNRIVVQFLQDTHLIGGKNAVIDLSRAELSHDDLSRANLSRADLSEANLIDANLSRAILSGTILSDAYLIGAYLSGTNLIDANLSGAFLSDADLSSAYLDGADLSGADLSGAILSGAILSGADLRYTHDLTQQQLDQVDTCQGAILPEGLTCHHNQ